jgi:hypothetical protein
MGLASNKLCISCDFWNQVYEDKDNYIFINGKSYQVCDEEWNGIRGFGGKEFKIKMNNGSIIKTTNLWTQGRIPKRWKYKLVDNAEFIERG